MAMKGLRPSEVMATLDVIDPDAYAADTYTTAWLSAADFAAYKATVFVGTLGSSATIDAKIEEATDSSGSDVQDLSGSDITQITQAGTDQSDTQAEIEFFQEDLDLADGFTHFRLSVTVGTATSDMGATVVGIDPRYGPASDSDASTVGEIVTV